MTPRGRKHLMWGAASLTFGLFLVYFGNERGLFGGESRWFAITVFALAWLGTVALLGRYFRDNPPAGSEGSHRKDH